MFVDSPERNSGDCDVPCFFIWALCVRMVLEDEIMFWGIERELLTDVSQVASPATEGLYIGNAIGVPGYKFYILEAASPIRNFC